MQRLIKILFVCHGNICRSTMAEAMMNAKIQKYYLEGMFQTDSAATSYEEIGEPMYYAAQETLKKHHIPIGNHRARRITPEDYERFDLLIGMDSANIRNMKRMFGDDPEHKVFKLLEFAGRDEDISDPWYTRNFDLTYEQIDEGLNGLIEKYID